MKEKSGIPNHQVKDQKLKIEDLHLQKPADWSLHSLYLKDVLEQPVHSAGRVININILAKGKIIVFKKYPSESPWMSNSLDLNIIACRPSYSCILNSDRIYPKKWLQISW